MSELLDIGAKLQTAKPTLPGLFIMTLQLVT